MNLHIYFKHKDTGDTLAAVSLGDFVRHFVFLLDQVIAIKLGYAERVK